MIILSLLGAEAPGQRQSSAARPGRSERLSCGEGTQERTYLDKAKGAVDPPVSKLSTVWGGSWQ